jgi:tetratricopeptide (TPR) repeat protein
MLNELRAKRMNGDLIVAFVHSAILNDNILPWMYEALAITLYTKGAPMKEVERAALSAADFCENPLDMMNLGLLLRSIGLKDRAFHLYKQSLEVMAPNREFYSATLRLAEELYNENQDEEALRWIALAVLSQEWDGSVGRKMTQKALDDVQMLEAKMKNAGKTEEAEQLAGEVCEARLRDCIITVEWTGNAGLDMMVREPTDSYCWIENPRSTVGGLLKPVPVAQDGTPVDPAAEQSGVKRISYVCPKGFNGTYGIILRKDWGELTNNKVRIHIDTNTAADEIKSTGKTCTMQPEGVIVCFNMENGRRTEPIEEGELTAANIQMSVAQQMLARNNALKRLADDGVLGQIVGGTGQTGTGSGSASSGSRERFPFRYESIVGYRPIVTTIPDGAMFSTNAVVSADRRYVRLSPSPQFSSIRSVYSYSMAAGSDDLDSGGGMGGGMGGMSGGMGGMGGGMGGMSGGMGGMSGGMGGMSGGMGGGGW